MEKELFLTEEKDLIYINNESKAFLLTEAIGFNGIGNYDMVFATSCDLAEDGDGIHYVFDFEEESVTKWWFGSSDYYHDKEAFLQACSSYLDKKRDLFIPETIYTGGNIWLSAMWIDSVHYVTIDNEDRYDDTADSERYLYCYNSLDDDPVEEVGEFQCMNPIWVKDFSEMSEEERKWYDMLLADMKENAY